MLQIGEMMDFILFYFFTFGLCCSAVTDSNTHVMVGLVYLPDRVIFFVHQRRIMDTRPKSPVHPAQLSDSFSFISTCKKQTVKISLSALSVHQFHWNWRLIEVKGEKNKLKIWWIWNNGNFQSCTEHQQHHHDDLEERQTARFVKKKKELLKKVLAVTGKTGWRPRSNISWRHNFEPDL